MQETYRPDANNTTINTRNGYLTRYFLTGFDTSGLDNTGMLQQGSAYDPQLGHTCACQIQRD